MHQSLKNFFQSQKKKISSHGNFTLSLLGQYAVWTNSTSGKKNLKENNTPLRVVKNQEGE